MKTAALLELPRGAGMNHQVTLALPEILLYFDTNTPSCPGNIFARREDVALIINDSHPGFGA